MSDDAQWGPWIDHDGKGLPVPICTLGEAMLRSNRVFSFYAGCGFISGGRHFLADSKHGSAWVWGSAPPLYRCYEVVRYRIRKRCSLRDLIELVENLPAPERERSDA